MAADLHAPEDQRYMKGRSRHLFWLMLVLMLIGFGYELWNL